MNKITIFHFHNGQAGGVLSVIRNLLKYSKSNVIENHVIYTINKEQTPTFFIPGLEGAASEQVFYYSPKWNFYYTCRQLAKLLPNDNSIIVAHDWLELGMLSNLGLQNQVVHVLHGCYKYYFDLAIRHKESVDKFVTIARDINHKISSYMPDRIDDIAYIRPPVSDNPRSISAKEHFNVVFVGNPSYEKGYSILQEIAKRLEEWNMLINWHIIGVASDENASNWATIKNVKFHGKVDHTKIFDLLNEMKIILLPSIAEGMPISLIEAMKCGVIPVANDIPGGIQEIVINGITGFKIPGNEIDAYVKIIRNIYYDKALSENLMKNSIKHINTLFDSSQNVDLFENLLLEFSREKPTKIAFKSYGSRLDQQWLPNFITKVIRFFL